MKHAAIMRTSRRLLGVEMQDGTVARQMALELGENFDAQPADVQAKRAAELVARAGWTAKRVTLVLPRSRVLVREFSLPQGSPAELEQMIHHQLERDLGLPLEEVRSAYSVAPPLEGQVAISAAAVRRDDLERERAILAGAGIEVDSVVVSTWGLAARAEALVAGRLEPSAVAYLESDYGEIVLIERTRPVAARSLEALGRDAFVAEVMRTVPALEAQRRSGPATDLIVSADDARTLGRSLEEAWLASRKVVVRMLDAGDGAAPALAPLVGACAHVLRKNSPAGPDLLVEPVTPSIWRTHRVKILAGAGALLFLLAWGGVKYHLSSLASDLTVLQDAIKKQEPEVKRLMELKGRAKLLDEWTTDRISWAQLLVTVTRAEKSLGSDTEKKLYLKSLSMDTKGKITLTGEVKDEPVALDFMRALEASAPIRNVEFPVTTKNEGKRTDFLYKFTISAEIDAEQCGRPEALKPHDAAH